MESMADLMKKLGWIAWCLTVIGWFLSPIISLLVNKIFAYLVFDASKKLKELENEIIRKLKQTLGAVEEQTVLRAAEDNPSQSNLKILDSMKTDLKSALYEAEDILDLLDYRRIEKGIYLGDDGSRRWVEHKLDAACGWIARCKGSSFGRWLHATLAAVMKRAQSMIRQGQLVIQRWRHFDLYSICRAINIVDAAVLQCVQSWYQQRVGQLCRRSGIVPLLPVSSNPTGQPPILQSRGSEFVPAQPAHRPAEGMVDEKEIVEELEEMPEEIEEGCGEVGETSEEEIEEENCEGEVGEMLEEVREENDEEGKEGEPTSLSILLQYCARSMLTWFAKACFYRDWSYGIVGIKSNKGPGGIQRLDGLLLVYLLHAPRRPSWMLSPQHPDAPQQLQKLELWHCSQLASIPKDSKLIIGLRELNIYQCNWDWLPRNMERLVSLQTLMILGCNKVEHLPKLPHQSLQVIRIMSCNVLSKTCKEEGHANWQKIKDIPKKEIW